VAYGNGKIFMTGQDRKYVYSEDGITWTLGVLSVVLNNAYKVLFADNKFLVMSQQGGVAYSEDFINWNYYNVPISPGNVAWSISYANGNYLVSTSEDLIYYSNNFRNWTQVSINTGGANVAWVVSDYIAGKYIVLGWNHSAYSTDLNNWTVLSLVGTSAQNINFWKAASSSSNILVGGTSGSDAVIVGSTDGIDWLTVDSASQSSIGYNVRYIPETNEFLAPARGYISSYSRPEGVPGYFKTSIPAPFNIDNFDVSEIIYAPITRLTETLNIIGGQGTTQTEEFLPITVYTVPEDKQTTVTSIFVANHDDSESTYDLAVVPAGEEISLKHHIRWDMAVAGKDFENISTKITMSAGDKLVIFPSTADTVSITAFGVEK